MSDQRVAFDSKLLQLGILYVIAFIIGVTANGIILYALIFLKRRTVSEVFVLNLVSGTPLTDSNNKYTVFLKKDIDRFDLHNWPAVLGRFSLLQ